MKEPRTAAFRRILPWVTAAALLVVTAVAISRVVVLREEVRAQEETQLKQLLQDRVASWEDQLLTQVEAWIQTTIQDPGRARAVQQRLRRQETWFDSLYLWTPVEEIESLGPPRYSQPELLYPRPPVVEGSLLSRPCLARARQLTREDEVDVVDVARAYQEWCADEELAVRIVAATEAAFFLERAGRVEDALGALDSSGLDPTTRIREGLDQGISPFRLVTHRSQRADLLRDLGRTEEALQLYYETGEEVTQLDAPNLQLVLRFVEWPMLTQLDEHGRNDQARQLTYLKQRAERRLRAFREITERIMPRALSTTASEGTRFIYDQYGDPPFLLFYGVVETGEEPVGVALQLDQPLLLQDFIQSTRRLRDDVVILDASNQWVAGSREVDDLAMTVPFNRTLTHLRVGLRQQALDQELERLQERWFLPLILVIVAVVVGFVSVRAQMKANRQQQLLLQRQREFTTRVTHELKTPLAGIKIMAENLETGAYGHEGERRQMARSIVSEADRLTSRVDEILSVSRERKLPEERPFDPEEVVVEAVMDWEPRMRQSGVKLTAELDVTDEVVGHANSLRDAVSCLLDNALKYRDETREEPFVAARLLQDGDSVIIEVEDNGIGVPEEMRDEIFERFVRVEGPNRGKSGGYGLGLAQVAAIIDAHRGHVTCEESPQGGTLFRITLPAAA